MRLVDVYTVPDAADILWTLLSERTPDASISHKAMPTPEGHQAFVARRPYAAWYLIDVGADYFVGAVYLTHQREIGIAILRRFRGFGYGRMATLALMDKHGPGRYLANVAPRNFVSQAMFTDIGARLIQYTYELTK